jgi:hypothetical protein
MTKTTAIHFLPLIQALAEGKNLQIQCTTTGQWEDAASDILFNHPYGAAGYRIKPEPREWTLYRFGSNGRYLYKTDDADPAFPINERIRVREILD